MRFLLQQAPFIPASIKVVASLGGVTVGMATARKQGNEAMDPLLEPPRSCVDALVPVPFDPSHPNHVGCQVTDPTLRGSFGGARSALAIPLLPAVILFSSVEGGGHPCVSEAGNIIRHRGGLCEAGLSGSPGSASYVIRWGIRGVLDRDSTCREGMGLESVKLPPT